MKIRRCWCRRSCHRLHRYLLPVSIVITFFFGVNKFFYDYNFGNRYVFWNKTEQQQQKKVLFLFCFVFLCFVFFSFLFFFSFLSIFVHVNMLLYFFNYCLSQSPLFSLQFYVLYNYCCKKKKKEIVMYFKINIFDQKK